MKNLTWQQIGLAGFIATTVLIQLVLVYDYWLYRTGRTMITDYARANPWLARLLLAAIAFGNIGLAIHFMRPVDVDRVQLFSRNREGGVSMKRLAIVALVCTLSFGVSGSASAQVVYGPGVARTFDGVQFVTLVDGFGNVHVIPLPMNASFLPAGFVLNGIGQVHFIANVGFVHRNLVAFNAGIPFFTGSVAAVNFHRGRAFAVVARAGTRRVAAVVSGPRGVRVISR